MGERQEEKEVNERDVIDGRTIKGDRNITRSCLDTTMFSFTCPGGLLT